MVHDGAGGPAGGEVVGEGAGADCEAGVGAVGETGVGAVGETGVGAVGEAGVGAVGEAGVGAVGEAGRAAGVDAVVGLGTEGEPVVEGCRGPARATRSWSRTRSMSSRTSRSAGPGDWERACRTTVNSANTSKRLTIQMPKLRKF